MQGTPTRSREAEIAMSCGRAAGELFGRFVLHDHGAIHDHVQPLPRDMAVVVADRFYTSRAT